MNQITDPPLNHDFGLDFNYWVWTANTELTLTNVPWNNDYRDVVYFESTAKLNQYIDSMDSENTRIRNSTYAPVDRPIQIDLPYPTASRFNYVRVYNPAQPVPGGIPQYLYYFITGARYIGTNNTELTVQLDVFQTFIRQVQFGRCYIERGHIGIANSANFNNYGRDFLTVPEGIDLGAEYVTVGSRQERIIGGTGYNILVASTIELDGPSGTQEKPTFQSAKGSVQFGVPSGAKFYVFPGIASFMAFLNRMADKPWITQGIVSATIIPSISRYYPGFSNQTSGIGAYRSVPTGIPSARTHALWPNWRNVADIRNYLPPRYRNLRKFFTFPYMVIELTTHNGTPIILKPESWNSDDAHVREMAALMPPEQRIVFSPAGYNSLRKALGGSATGVPTYAVDGGDWLDIATQVTNLPKLAVVNNGALSYLAANARSIAYGYQSADWSQQRALEGSATAYDQARMGISGQQEITRATNNYAGQSLGIQQNLQNQQHMSQSIGNIATGAAMGMLGGPAGAAIGAAGGAAAAAMSRISLNQSQDAATQQMRLTAGHNWDITNINNQTAQYIADTNYNLAQWAARGDYANTVAGLNAKVQDAQMIPPSVSGQMGGEFLNFVSGDGIALTAKWKMIDQASIAVIGEYWLRYGYAVRRHSYLPPNLQAMTRFTYWKLTETYLRAGAIPEGFKQAIRGIFEKGVTVWADPEYIGVTDPADNQPLSGINLNDYNPPVPPIEPLPEPEPVKKRKKKNMIVFRTTDPESDIYALAGTSPGTAANWIETRDPARGLAFMQACGVDDPVPLTEADFYTYKGFYMEPVQVDAIDNGEVPPEGSEA